MTPTVEEVKSLRKETGYGMMDCKKALSACNNDKEKAIEYLKNIIPHYVMRDKWEIK